MDMLKSCVAYIIASRDFQEAFVLRYKVHHTDAPFPIELNRELAAQAPVKFIIRGKASKINRKGGLRMDDNEKNVTTVCEEDKKFINDIMNLAPEKKILVRGILIGLDLQEKQKPLAAAQ